MEKIIYILILEFILVVSFVLLMNVLIAGFNKKVLISTVPVLLVQMPLIFGVLHRDTFYVDALLISSLSTILIFIAVHLSRGERGSRDFAVSVPIVVGSIVLMILCNLVYVTYVNSAVVL